MPIARPTVIAAALFAGLIDLYTPSSPQERTLVEFDFTASAQGWVVSGDTGSAEPVFRPSGGSPGGHISNVDEALGETWYFRAPDSLLKQLAAAENGTLSYSLKQSADIPSVLDDDVIIVGPAGRLSFRFGTSPGTELDALLGEARGRSRVALELERARDSGTDPQRARQSDEPRNPRRVPHRTRRGRARQRRAQIRRVTRSRAGARR